MIIIIHVEFLLGYLALGIIFENMLQLKRFYLYLKGILNRTWLISYRNKSATEMLGGSGAYSQRKFGND